MGRSVDSHAWTAESGTLNRTQVPPSFPVDTVNSCPRNSAVLRAIDSPNPIPWLNPRKRGVKLNEFCIFSSEIPGPESYTHRTRQRPSMSEDTDTPPCSVCLTALPTKLFMI